MSKFKKSWSKIGVFVKPAKVWGAIARPAILNAFTSNDFDEEGEGEVVVVVGGGGVDDDDIDDDASEENVLRVTPGQIFRLHLHKGVEGVEVVNLGISEDVFITRK